MGRKKNDSMAQALELASPVVGRPARLHDDGGLRLLRHEGQELPARQAFPAPHMARPVAEIAISKTAFATSTAMRVSFDMMGSSFALTSSDFGTRCRLSRRRSPSHQCSGRATARMGARR